MNKTVKAPPPLASRALLSERAKLEGELQAYAKAVRASDVTAKTFAAFVIEAA